METGEELNTFKGHCNKELLIRSDFSKDDNFVFSGSEDKNIFVWKLDETENGVNSQTEFCLGAHNEIVTTVKFNPVQNSFYLQMSGEMFFIGEKRMRKIN